MNEIKIGDGRIELLRGDIAEQDTEAVVNAANNYLWMGSGVAGAIKAKGGDEIETEAISKGPIEIGEAVLTRGGKLKAKYVIHAAAMGQDLSTDAEIIKKTTRSVLTLAENKSISSLSLPALGTGVGGFSVEACGSLMLKECVDFLQSSKKVKLLRFVLFSEEDFSEFESALQSIFSV